MAKGVIRKFIDLNKAQKADVRRRMKSPYVGYYYKVYGGKVAYRIRMGKA